LWIVPVASTDKARRGTLPAQDSAMSLFGTINQSAGALQAAQIGLQVVGNNLANVSTPGYIRQELQQASAKAVREGNLIKGAGVRVTGVVQVIDKALVERMINAKTAVSGAASLQKAYSQLEELTTDLDNTGLNQQLSLFNNALHELSSQPADISLRDFVILQGDAMASSFRRNREGAVDRREVWNKDLGQISHQINRLTERIAQLNLEIATIEGGGLIQSDATGLRDQRYRDLEELGTYININTQEQESGSVAVFVGGDYLVSNGNHRDVYTAYDNTTEANEVRIIETDSPLLVTSGILSSTMIARDKIFGNYIDGLDEISSALIRIVNEVHSQGQGRLGFDELLSNSPTDVGVPLADSGLPYVPRNGSFDMTVVDAHGQPISSHRIQVSILGQVTDSTISSIAADIDAIEGVSASLTSEGRIHITSDSATSGFTFGEDTSGFLAAAGINTFFSGSSAADIAVNETLLGDSDYLAISSGGVGEDTDVLTELIDIIDRPVDHLDNRSVRAVYEASVAKLGQEIGLHESAVEGLRSFHATLESQHLSITGVNIDEESIKMISYQRAFQASSRVIATANEMLELLVSL
jgi:flagellar hook-associated protein 1 FlgK